MHELLSSAQVAQLCKVSLGTIHREIMAGHLIPSFKSEGKQRTRYLFTREDVLAYQAWRTKTYNEQFDPRAGRGWRVTTYELLAIGLFCGCVLGAGIATIMQYVVPLERVRWFRLASFWLLRVAAVALIVLAGLMLLG